MEIDRNMARYLLEIKRSLPRAQQNEFNLSSPNIKKIVLDLHRTTTNRKIKTLAAAFLEQVNRSQQPQSRASEQISKPDMTANSLESRTNSEMAKIAQPSSSEDSTLAKPVSASDSMSVAEKIRLLKTGILPEFLEHIDVSELPPLAGSSSSHQGRHLNTDNTLKASKPTARSITPGTAILDKIVIFLTTPIELSMPIRFTKRRPDGSN